MAEQFCLKLQQDGLTVSIEQISGCTLFVLLYGTDRADPFLNEKHKKHRDVVQLRLPTQSLKATKVVNEYSEGRARCGWRPQPKAFHRAENKKDFR